MNGWTKPLALGVFVAVAAHLVVIGAIPQLIMGVALDRIAKVSGGWNILRHSEPVTPRTQAIVRSSPDLAYSTCALDLTKGPVRLRVAKGSDYASLALYDANTDNVFTLNDRAVPDEGVRIMVVSARSPVAAAPGEQVVSLSGNKGLMLVRRLAPTADAFERVAAERASDSCEAVVQR